MIGRARLRRLLGQSLLALSLTAHAAAGAEAADRPFFVQILEGKERVIVAFASGRIELRRIPDLAIVRQLGAESAGVLEGVAVAGNGRWLAAAVRGGALVIQDVEKGVDHLTIPGPESADERIFLLHPRDDRLFLFQAGRLEVWDVERGEAEETVRPIRSVQRMSISPDGRRLAVAGTCRTGCGDFGLCVVDLEEQVVLGGALEPFEDRSSSRVADLAYTGEDRIEIREDDGWTTVVPLSALSRRVAPSPVGWSIEKREDGWAGVALSAPSNTGALEPPAWRSPIIASEPVEAVRSAPGDQLRHRSPDGEWQVGISVDGTRLFLYRREPGEDPRRGYELDKLVRLP